MFNLTYVCLLGGVPLISGIAEWATTFRIHTPPVEDFGLHMECEFSSALVNLM